MSNATIITVPFNTLARAPENVRTQRASPEKIEAIAASILAQGLLQNLVGYAEGEGHNIVAGGNRLEAIGQLVERGEKPADWPVAVKVISKEEATIASLSENVARENMHPADEFDAARTLVNDGWSIDRIADALGVTPLVVERRLRLMAAAPELLQEFREGELSTDQMIALCASDDHERQVRTWKSAKGRHWMEQPKDLRRAVLADGEIDISSDSRIPFIGGLEVYRAAGGEVRADLFHGDGKSGGFITDEALLDSLVADKLDEHAAQLRAEGWGWVEIWPEWDWQDFHRLGNAPTTDADMPEPVREQIATLKAEAEALEAEQEAQHEKAEAEGRDDLTDEEWKRDGEIDDRVREIEREAEALETKHRTWATEVKAKAGAIVALERGQLRIERGMVKTADRKAVAAAAGDDNAVIGGRETESAGRKPDAVSDALRRSLIGHRNLAAQVEVAKRPDAAKVLLASWTVERIRNRMDGWRGVGVPTDLAINEGRYGGGRGSPITDESGKKKEEAFMAEVKAVAKALPTAEGALWDHLATLSGEELDKIIAYGVALSVSLFDDHKGLTAKLLDMLGFDMAEHFTPTAENYLGRVPKPLMIAALAEAKKIEGKDDEAALLAKKKGELATEAETRLAGTGWVPKGIRTPKPKAAAPAKAPAKKAAKKAAKKKAAPRKPKADKA